MAEWDQTDRFASGLVSSLEEVADTASNSQIEWNPNLLLALVGGVIVAGFLANLIFKVFKIPSVVKLMGIGLLRLVFKIIPQDQFFDIAPLFGKIALLIILFAGGLGLKIETVIQQLGNAVFLAFLAFGATFGITVPLALYVMEMDTIQAIILATLVAGTASSIVIPVVSKLSINDGLKTMISIESAISNLLILVVVIIAIDIHVSEQASFINIIGSFLLKILVSLGSAIIAGVLWGRLIGSMRENSLSYMLTLGFIFLLNYLVDILGGSGAISILFFGMMLSNVSTIFDRVAPRIKGALGIQVDSTKFVLNEFLKGISGELSFLVATFFFVYLGLLVSFDALTMEIIRNIGLLVGAILVGRLIILPLFVKVNKTQCTKAELIVLLAMMPRGLATAVMAFKPGEKGIEGTDLFPLYAMFAILLSNLLMTAFVKIGENFLKRERKNMGLEDAVEDAVPEFDLTSGYGASLSGYEVRRKGVIPHRGQMPPGVSVELEKELAQKELDALEEPSKSIEELKEKEETTPKEEAPVAEAPRFNSVSEMIFHWMDIGNASLNQFDRTTVRSLKMRDMVFWVKLFLMTTITTLGLLMDTNEIVLAALLLSPLTALQNTMGLSTVRGDVYMFLKGIFKIIVVIAVVLFISATITGITPFTGITDVILNRIQPTILDFILAFVTGMVLPVLLLRGQRLEVFAITPIVGVLLLPPLATIGYALGAGPEHSFFNEVLLGGTLSFGANFIALIIGSVLTMLILGMGKAPASKYILDWHEEEVEKGILHTWFERLKLVKLLETVGTSYSRIILLAVMSVIVFIPLQITFREIQQDYQVTQQLNKLSQKYFEVEEKSHVLETGFEKKNKQAIVTIVVATKEAFSKTDMAEFEQEMEKTLGLPVVLRLQQSTIQSLDESGTDLLVTSGDGKPDLFLEKLDHLGADADNILASLPNLETVKFVGFKTDYHHIDQKSYLIIETVGDEKLMSDMENLVKREISQKLAFPADQIRIIRLPAHYNADRADAKLFEDETGIFFLTEIMDKSEEVMIEVSIPRTLNPDQASQVTDSLRKSYSGFSDTTRVKIIQGTQSGFRARIY